MYLNIQYRDILSEKRMVEEATTTTATTITTTTTINTLKFTHLQRFFLKLDDVMQQLDEKN